MNKNTGIIIGVVALIAIIGVSYASMSDKPTTVKEEEVVKETMVVEEKNMNTAESVKDVEMKKDGVMVAGTYEVYAPEKVARAATGDVVLFFHASWCPSCRGLNSDIEKNIDGIPETLSILKVNYDAETELKKKYGVTYQHTLVQVDEQGNMIKKWSGSSSLSKLVSEVQ